MSLLIISWENGNKTKYSDWLSDYKGSIILICRNNHIHTYSKNFFKEIYSTDEWTVDNLLKISREICNENKINHIIALDELDLIVAAKLREEFLIEGEMPKSIYPFRNKYMMKNLASLHGIKVPKYTICRNLEDIIKFKEQVNSAIVVKPVSGIGSVSTNIMLSIEDIKNWYSNYGSSIYDFLFEEYIDGTMYHIDGLVEREDLKLLWPSKYINNGIDQIKNSYFASYLLPSDSKYIQTLYDFTRNVINIFPFYHTSTFHLEVFISNKGEIIFCEIAARTVGAYYTENLKYIFHDDLNKLYTRSILGLESINSKITPRDFFLKNPLGFLMFGPPRGHLYSSVYIPVTKDIIEYHFFGEVNKLFNGSQNSADGIAYIILDILNEKDFLNKISKYRKMFYHNILQNE